MTTIIIPAHNEAAVIATCLGALLAHAEPAEFTVIVVCNGCSDDTGTIARRFDSGSHFGHVVVVEICEASKVSALNEGIELAETAPLIFLDADVRLSTESAREIAAALTQPGIMAASTAIELNLVGASMLSRSYHRFWRKLPSIAEGLAGRGVYGLSPAGLERLGTFPQVIADDRFVDLLFDTSERATTASTSMISVSRSARDLIARKVRVFAGNDEIERGRTKPIKGSWLTVVTKHPQAVMDLPAYIGINLIAKLGARWAVRTGRVSWNTDAGSRSVQP